MKRLFIILFMVLTAGTLCTGLVNATPFNTPGSITVNGHTLSFGSDLDDIGRFRHSSTAVSIELLDIGDKIDNPLVGSTFGFYFVGSDVTNIANLYKIFDILDAPSLPTPTQVAVIDFSSGVVYDWDSGGTVEQTFTASTASIGFFLSPDPKTNLPILFSESALNGGGTDVSGTYPVYIDGALSPGDDLISFVIPGISPLSAHYVDGISPVPEPSTLLLLASGLGGLWIYKRRKMK